MASRASDCSELAAVNFLRSNDYVAGQWLPSVKLRWGDSKPDLMPDNILAEIRHVRAASRAFRFPLQHADRDRNYQVQKY